MNRIRLVDLALLALLITVGVAARVAFQVIPNFAPVAAIALFAGYAFRSRILAAAAPLGVMFVSDFLVIGGYHPAIMAVVYSSLALPVLAGHWLRTKRDWSTSGTLAALMGSSLAASVLFFITTNFACWWLLAGVYAPTFAGLVECYTFALPFFRYTMTGDLLFAAALFGSSLALQSMWQSTASAEAGTPAASVS